ncbi:hypothetical protein [Caulobacter mirabilis]|uniref:Phosphatidylinositol diacylglycerol-lyase n=1 Tax=Caulobacter mirabilis TaxID=69666 RepID=A0A2D2AZP0_9CAUL|nr:hypothetical protein [Caulobacter mirabilis]ATQ43473.1 hypothetical protein CSW64_14165 [Caulobacter mirabilis]
MSIDCREVHGDHGFCHCVMSHAGGTPRQPMDGEWSRLAGGQGVTAFVRSIFNLGEGEGRLTMGRLQSDGGLASTMIRDMHGIYLSLSGAGAALARSAIIAQTDIPLTALNLRNDETGSHIDVWTAQGWMSTSGADIGELQVMMRQAIPVNGRFHYRVLINGAGQGGFILSADQPFNAVLYKAPVLVQKQAMRVAADSPGLHIILMRSMEDQTFPLGALLTIRASDGTTFDREVFTDSRFVKRTGRSVRGVFLHRPAAATFELEVVAIKGTGFHLLFQNAPRAEILPTMQKALSTIYRQDMAECCDRAHGENSLQCSLCLVAGAAVAFTTFLIATAAVVGSVAFTGGTILASFATCGLTIGRILLMALVSLGSNGFLTAICYMLGSCDASPEIKRVVDSGRGNTQRYDQLCYLTTHNAFSYRSLVAPLSAQQGHSIRRQLESGVEALMLDIWRYASPDDAYLCHEPCDSWKRHIVGRPEGPMKLAAELTQVVEVLAAEPQRIVTLIFESRLGNPAPDRLLTTAFDQAGATSRLFYADRENVRGDKRWNVATQGWPTRRWMIDNDFRLVVFSDSAAETWSSCQVRDADGLPFLWRYAAETVYGDDSMNLDKPAATRRCSLRFTDRMPPLPNGERRWPLLIMNYFPTFAVGSFNQAAFHIHNSYARLSAKTNQVTDAAGRPPNFLAIDYFELGADDGPRRVWTEANQRWSAHWTATEADADTPSLEPI